MAMRGSFDSQALVQQPRQAPPVGRALRIYVNLSGASSYSFAAGTLALLAFAIRNLPF